MHDPLTVAHEIKNPFRVRKVKSPNGSVWKYRNALVTIWHKDPEADGSDDSCGWFRPNLTKRQLSNIKLTAMSEAREPWFLAATEGRISDPVMAEALLRGTFLLMARMLRVKVSVEEATRWSILLLHNPDDNIRSSLAFLPGYHSNWEQDREEDRIEHAQQLFSIVAKYILRERRPWYRHPRWHVHHWQIQIHPVMHFKRWAFSRCASCGGRFRWGYAPVSGSWYGTGPLWFKSEQGVRHSDCAYPASEGADAIPAVQAGRAD